MARRRLPVYLLIDTSGSMAGDPIAAVNNGLQMLRASLLMDPQALDTVHLSIITFDRDVKVVLPLTPLDEVQLPELVTPESGPTHTGAALAKVRERVSSEVLKNSENQKADWLPYLFLMTDGAPSDIAKFKAEAQTIRSAGFQSIIGMVAGHDAKKEQLESFCDHVVELKLLTPEGLVGLFNWVSQAITSANNSRGTGKESPLPPPPPQIDLT